MDTPSSNGRGCSGNISRKVFVALCLTGITLGTFLGIVIKKFFILSEEAVQLMRIPGITVMHIFQCFTIPFFLSSVMTGASRFTANISRKTALRIAVYFGSTTVLSVITGFVLVLLLKPGGIYVQNMPFFNVVAILDLFSNLSVTNVVRSYFMKYYTKKMEFVVPHINLNSSLEMHGNATEVSLENEFIVGVNVFGLVGFFFLFGLALEAKTLVYLCFIVKGITKYAINWILWYLPFGLIFMSANLVIDVHNWEMAWKLLKFIAVVLTGLAVHGAICLPLVYLLFVWRNPFTRIRAWFSALQSAMLNPSSSGTQTRTSHCCNWCGRTSCRITSLLLSIGTNINMDGTALYMVIAAGFIAQLNHIHLDLSQTINIGVLAAIASTTFGEIPSARAVSSLFLLALVEMPMMHIPLLVLVEWLLDCCNNVINVLSDYVGVTVFHQLFANDEETEI